MKKPIKTNRILPRHEIFVHALASGYERADAYVQAYPKTAGRPREQNTHAAFKLLQRPEVAAAYEAEVQKHRDEEAERNRWTYERSISERLKALDAIEKERERRSEAQKNLAMAMLKHPPAGMTAEEVVIEMQKILMQPLLTAQTTSAVASLCDGLDKLTGLQSTESCGQVNMFISNDPFNQE